MEVDLRDMAHLAPHVHAELAASEVRAGDLLIVKASVGEKICRVPTAMEKANITQHIIAIRPNGKYDFDYLTAFLFGKYGRRQLERRSLGSIIQYLGIVDSKTVLFPKLDDKAQAYIGDKVRQAERLRARARTLQADMDRLITLDPLQLALSSPNQRTNRVRAVQLEPRLDAKFYSPRSMRVFAAALACDGVLLGDLKPEISNGFEHRTFVDKGRAYVTVTQVNSLRLDLSDVPYIPESIPVPDRARLTDRTVLAVRSGVTIGTVVKVHEEDCHACVSSHFIILRFSSDAQAAAVAVFLNSTQGRSLQDKIVYGGVIPQISQEDLLSLPVPRSVIDAGDQLLLLLNAKEVAARHAHRLTTAAKLLVEGLINGHVTESDLQAAHADRDADRAILRRLTGKGLDVTEETPLFPDLDQLEQALCDAGGATL
jgi:type I restriction enzyme S subunit